MEAKFKAKIMSFLKSVIFKNPLRYLFIRQDRFIRVTKTNLVQLSWYHSWACKFTFAFICSSSLWLNSTFYQRSCSSWLKEKWIGLGLTCIWLTINRSVGQIISIHMCSWGDISCVDVVLTRGRQRCRSDDRMLHLPFHMLIFGLLFDKYWNSKIENYN
jgi:hypothetical protein